ncbi:hypothetical protein AX16_003440 [Volvariella volvacea WC 439]|nr:hypothetical protein AX16_003440 [Volvariella volvacea WC 439]
MHGLSTSPSITSTENYNDIAQSPQMDSKFNSVRSILRDPNTPGTGQNVRFFSRDAYRVISPDPSTDTDFNSPNAQPPKERPIFLERLHANSDDASLRDISPSTSNSQPSKLEVSSPIHAIGNSNSPLLVDLSDSIDPNISPESPEKNPVDHPLDLRLGAMFTINSPTMKMDDLRSGDHYGPITSTPFVKTKQNSTFTPASDAYFAPSSPIHERSQSLSLSQSVFHSMSPAYQKAPPSDGGGPATLNPQDASTGDSAPRSPLKAHQSRAMSDNTFSSFINSPPGHFEDSTAEAFTNPRNSSQPSGPSPEPDPFNARANTYYTPQTMIPATPPGGPASRHVRKPSKEENLIFSLQTQLNLQTELCSQYEADLRARDELVEVLSKRMQDMEKEETKRKTALRQWKKKVAELEKTCRFLEEEIEGSRNESMERSLMDEAGEEALRMLHRQIAGFENERSEWQRREEALQDEVAKLEDLMNQGTGPEKTEANEKAILFTRLQSLERVNEALETTTEELRQQLQKRNTEYTMLKGEVEAQWSHTEQASLKIQSLETGKVELEVERAELKQKVKSLEEKISNMELEWNDADSKKNTLEAEMEQVWRMKDALEVEKHKLEKELQQQQEHVNELIHALQEGQDRINELDQERQFAIENTERLEENLRKRDKELTDLTQRIIDRESQSLELQEEISRMKWEHTRALDDRTRQLQEALTAKAQSKTRLEDLVKERAEVDIELQTTKDRIAPLKDEADRLRRQVHELQQESADKEVKIVQLTKQRMQDKEDLNGLNIALDAKQQELELLKRRLGVRGTAGSTSAQTVAKPTSHRRESIGNTRPPSVMSSISELGKDTNSQERRSSAEDSGKLSTLGRSAKVNGPSTRSSIGSSATLGPRAPSRSVASSVRRVSSPTSSASQQNPISTTLTANSIVNKVKPSTVPGQDEKENLDVTPRFGRNMVVSPMP